MGALATRRERSTAQRWLALARLLESGKKRGACREERALGLAGGLGCRWAEVQGVGEGGRLRGGEGGKLVVVVYAVVLEESLEGDREREREKYSVPRIYSSKSRLSVGVFLMLSSPSTYIH